MHAPSATCPTMMLATSTGRGTSLMMIEGGLTAIAIALSFCCPSLANAFFYRVEHIFKHLAARKWLAIVVVGASAILLRLAIIPLCPVPHPFLPNDFSFLLAADTFAAGRLTNPTPVMWIHFESIHISMQPTYMSMYFPAQGLVLAAGKVLLGNPWYGVLFASASMCAAICWMLQAWLPPSWALLGGLLAVLRLGLFSYWINTYSGGGSIAALGGALVLGAMRRTKQTGKLRYGLLLAAGVVLLAMTRPYEGILLCLPVVANLGHWLYERKHGLEKRKLLRLIVVPAALIVAAGAWMGYYDYRAFGSPFTPPYATNRAAYAMAPYYVWQSPRKQPAYNHQAMKDFYYKNELSAFNKIHSLTGFIPQTLFKQMTAILFFAGMALLPPLIMMRRVLMDRRTRFLVICVLVLMVGMTLEVFLIPHYLAPFTAVFYVLGLQGMRHLRVWNPSGKPVGRMLVQLTVTLCFIMGGLRLYALPLHMQQAEQPPSEWIDQWYGPGIFGVERASMQTRLELLPGRQLMLVRYSSAHNPYNEWVYNAPDIDNSKVIWAREMDVANNRLLINYYKDRRVWLVQPDISPVTFISYPGPESRIEPIGAPEVLK